MYFIYIYFADSNFKILKMKIKEVITISEIYNNISKRQIIQRKKFVKKIIN